MPSSLARSQKLQKEKIESQQTEAEEILAQYEAEIGTVELKSAHVDWKKSRLLHATPSCPTNPQYSPGLLRCGA